MNRIRTVAAVLVVLVCAGAAQIVTLNATPTTYTIQGTIVSASTTAALGSMGIAIGDSFTLSFNVDPDLATDINPNAGSGVYFFTESPVTANVAGLSFSSTGLSVIVGDDVNAFPIQDFVTIQGAAPFTSTLTAPFEVVGLTVGLASSDLTTISETARDGEAVTSNSLDLPHVLVVIKAHTEAREVRFPHGIARDRRKRK